MALPHLEIGVVGILVQESWNTQRILLGRNRRIGYVVQRIQTRRGNLIFTRRIRADHAESVFPGVSTLEGNTFRLLDG